MRVFLFCFWLFYNPFGGFTKSLNQYLNVGKDSSTAIVAAGKIQLANSGFAPVPAFSFDDPIATTLFTLQKKRFSYEPDFALGLNGNPWMINNWLRIKIIDKKIVTVKTGINASLFFESELTDAGEDVLHAQRNVSFDVGVESKISDSWRINFTYLHNYGRDPGALSGNFLDIAGSFSPLTISKTIFLSFKQQLFYFGFGDLKGLSTSTNIRVLHDRFPLALFIQGVLPLWANFPGNDFKWNTGIEYSF